MKKFTVLLPIDVAGRIYQHGEVVELDEDQAKDYAHAVRAVKEEEESDGGNG